MRRTLGSASLVIPFILLTLFFEAARGSASDNTTVAHNAQQSITAHTECRNITNGSATGRSVYVPTQTAVEWQSFRDHPPAGVTLSPCATEISISGTQTNLNLFTLAGSPTTPGAFIFTIQPGAIINSNSSSQAALTTGTGWQPGSTITIINNGSIYGRGGDGGAGGGSSKNSCTGSGGFPGGPALSISFVVTLNNSNGRIFGGGGGGGGGAAMSGRGSCVYFPGGGGGGGQGSEDSLGGAGRCGGSSCSQSGSAGTAASPGGGGNGSQSSGPAKGGAGGAWGTTGAQGGTSTTGHQGGAGGAAGKAIITNGHAITWLGGDNATQVRGAVQ